MAARDCACVRACGGSTAPDDASYRTQRSPVAPRLRHGALRETRFECGRRAQESPVIGEVEVAWSKIVAISKRPRRIHDMGSRNTSGSTW